MLLPNCALFLTKFHQDTIESLSDAAILVHCGHNFQRRYQPSLVTAVTHVVCAWHPMGMNFNKLQHLMDTNARPLCEISEILYTIFTRVKLPHCQCGMVCHICNLLIWWMPALIARFMGQHGTQLGLTGPRWAPCWPHKPCNLGYYCINQCAHYALLSDDPTNVTVLF